ncbi:GntR family transcriptional regulator [Thermodesulfobacteriota bacterium]
MNDFNFTQPQSLVDQLKENLSDAIVRGVLLPGQQIKEQELQEWFKVSRAPIREALRLLEGDGLIIVDNYKKRYVRRITKRDLTEIVPIMICLEGLAARYATPRIEKEKIKELKDLNNQMRQASDQKDYGVCAELNFMFHGSYIRAADNHALERTMRSLTKGSIWLWLTNIYYKKDDMVTRSVEDHSKIIEALKKGDVEAAEQAAQYHIEQVYGRLLEYSIFDSAGDFVFDEQQMKGR